MIGLGVSSISDSWYGFAQNVKNVEEYLKLISEDKLPVIKGHILTYDDLIMRRHILNIMCKGYTQWDHHHGACPALIDSLDRLMALVDDELIELDDKQLKVTTLGKPFLRNICMALDARLWADKPTTQLFSMAV
jgi:oxygen-independent coproporphyrinogen-3 oxidase